MNRKDAATLKVLADLGLSKENPLTPEQERLIKGVLDPTEGLLQDVRRIFQRNCDDNETA